MVWTSPVSSHIIYPLALFAPLILDSSSSPYAMSFPNLKTLIHAAFLCTMLSAYPSMLLIILPFTLLLRDSTHNATFSEKLSLF